jgi:hypothetical protein
MWQFLYILAFAVLAVLAVGNLLRNLFTLGVQSRNTYGNPANNPNSRRQVTHPELLGDDGRVIDEPLLVMRSMTMEDARAHLDSLYHQSPSASDD